VKATQHGQYLIQLTRWWAFNCYLVREADGLTLIDAGLPGSAEGILAAAEAIKLPRQRNIWPRPLFWFLDFSTIYPLTNGPTG
jgi:glyoxylase-like metal-dependent hydrolase (beta-lactamase superfamily II)